METTLISRKSLPEPLFSCFKTANVRMSKERGRVTLSPVTKKRQSVDEITRELQAMCGGKLSVERFLRERAEEERD